MTSDLDAMRQTLGLERRLGQTEVREALRYTTGTFTPAYAGTGTPGTWTYSVAVGYFTRIGNRVLFELSIVVTARPVAPTGNARIVNLGFTSSADANSHAPVTLDTIDSVTLTGTQLTGRIPPGASYIELIEVPAGGGATNFLVATALTATAVLRASGHCHV